MASESAWRFDESVPISCPGCGATFHSPALLASHLNDSHNPCSLDASQIPYPVPPAFHSCPGEEATSHYHPTSGYIYGKGDILLDMLRANEYERRQEHVMFYPFTDEDKWGLAKFLARHLTQTAINKFLHLKWIILNRFEHGTNQPSLLQIKCLDGWTDCPVVWPGRAQHLNEFFAGNQAYHIQDQLPVGATIVPIIISSDKTNITCHTGALEMHPVFMTIGNIQSDVRMQTTLYAWRCVAFIPTSEFEVHPDFQMLLASHLFHQCMDIVFASLKETAQTGAAMTDSLRYVRNCFTPLVAYTADLPEQQLVAYIARNTSPVTTTTISEFGDPSPHPPRLGATMLEQIAVQSPIHTDASLALMIEALGEFHATKDAILRAEARRGAKGVKNDFNIPKRELFQSFTWNITYNGALIQYTADVTERLHITHCKIPFEQTNQNVNTFVDQVVGLLNREENIHRFDLYHILRSLDKPLETVVAVEDEAIAGVDPTLSFISH
ncbi:hypothetical protein OG21DRAFT_1528148, partial [Imleria badia]